MSRSGAYGRVPYFSVWLLAARSTAFHMSSTVRLLVLHRTLRPTATSPVSLPLLKGVLKCSGEPHTGMEDSGDRQACCVGSLWYCGAGLYIGTDGGAESLFAPWVSRCPYVLYHSSPQVKCQLGYSAGVEITSLRRRLGHLVALGRRFSAKTRGQDGRLAVGLRSDSSQICGCVRRATCAVK